MKFDWELARQLLLATQRGVNVGGGRWEDEGAGDAIRHIELLAQGGFLNLIGHYDSHNSTAPGYVAITSLAENGREFCRLFGNDQVWADVKAIFAKAEISSYPWEVLKDVGLAHLSKLAHAAV